MIKKGGVYLRDTFAGIITEDENGFSFRYDPDYLKLSEARPVSLTLPLREEAYTSPHMIPFFDGLIPEGWLLEIARENWKLDPKDRMSLLLAFCRNTIGAVSIIPLSENNPEENNER
ncbi:MAG TPA: HipA N-terminal domain-containing protein [Ignavibacteriales bacterium]|nr:HipA N-terminal domain-containing protein [Ignavibacteriales bacterium]